MRLSKRRYHSLKDAIRALVQEDEIYLTVSTSLIPNSAEALFRSVVKKQASITTVLEILLSYGFDILKVSAGQRKLLSGKQADTKFLVSFKGLKLGTIYV